GIRAAGLFAKAGADVCITSRKAEAGERARDLVLKRFGGKVRAIAMADASEAVRACERAELLLNSGPAGVMLVPRQAWANRPGLKVVADANDVPPIRLEGEAATDDRAEDGGRLFLDRSIPTAEALADPARFVGLLEEAGPLDLVTGPSGYGLPLTRARDATDGDLRLALLAPPGERGGIAGLSALLRVLA